MEGRPESDSLRGFHRREDAAVWNHSERELEHEEMDGGWIVWFSTSPRGIRHTG